MQFRGKGDRRIKREEEAAGIVREGKSSRGEMSSLSGPLYRRVIKCCFAVRRDLSVGLDIHKGQAGLRRGYFWSVRACVLECVHVSGR